MLALLNHIWLKPCLFQLVNCYDLKMEILKSQEFFFSPVEKLLM